MEIYLHYYPPPFLSTLMLIQTVQKLTQSKVLTSKVHEDLF